MSDAIFNGGDNGATGEFLKFSAEIEREESAQLSAPAMGQTSRLGERRLRFMPYMTLLAAHRCALRAGYAGITTEEIDGQMRVVPRLKLKEAEVPAFLKLQGGEH